MARAEAGPLAGIRVLDAGRLLPAAMATAELVRYGAEVVKLEFLPVGDYLRSEAPLVGGVGDMHLQTARGKRSVLIDPDDPAAGRRVSDLIGRSDVVVVSARDSSLARFGLDFESVSKRTPSVIYCTLLGFGSTGPYAALPAHGLSGDAAAGVVSPEINHDDTWAQPYISVGPRAAGLYCANAILATLCGRQRQARGRHIEVSMQEAALAWGGRGAVLAANDAGDPPRYSGLGHALRAYRTSDERWMLLSAVEPSAWRRLVRAADAGEPLASWQPPDTALSFEDDPAVSAALEQLFARRPLAEWLEVARRDHIPLSPFVDSHQLTADPHLSAREVFERVDIPGSINAWAIAHPVLIDGRRFNSGHLADAGEDNDLLTEAARVEVIHTSRPKTDDLTWRTPLVARSPSDSDGDVAALLGKLETAGVDLPIVRLLANSSGAARPFVKLADALMRKMTLPPRLRELVILRLGAHLGCGYELAEHGPFALEAGLEPHEIAQVVGGDMEGFSELEVTAMQMAVTLVSTGDLDDEHWSAFVAATSPETAVDLLLTIAWWGALVPTVIGGLRLALRAPQPSGA